MKRLVLVRGVPGAGKSTFASTLCKICPNCYQVEADQFFMKDGQYQYDGSKIREAHRWCFEMTKLLLENEEDVTVFVCNTFTRKFEMKKYFDLAEELGIPCTTIIVENRHGSSNTHDVPKDVVQKMKNRFEVVL